MLRISDLRMKDVIEASDGRRLGYIRDIEIDPNAGRIEALVIPAGRSWRSLLGRPDETILPWERITKLGVDVILVQNEAVGTSPKTKPATESRPWDEEFDFFDV